MRAQLYRVLARYLSAPPQQSDIDAAAALEGGEGPLGRAVARFAEVAGAADAASLADDYQTLFIGLGRGELVPYGSYYLTGFLHEKPLAKLRQDMAQLGLEREPRFREPEDHMATLCEAMAGLIEGAWREPLPIAEQKQFFERHIGSWAPYFFRDLEGTRTSPFYAALGGVGRAFVEIEGMAFGMD